jgi:rod shape-determining protein MreD
MSGAPSTGPRLGTAAFAACGLFAIYLQLVPFSHAAEGRGLPDLLFCLVAAWVLRRPASAPLWAVLGLGLLADLLLSRPLGLGTLGLVLASEVLRAKRSHIQAGSFAAEWLHVVALFALMLAGTALALRLAFAEGPGLAAMLDHATATAIGYPLAVMVLHFGLGLRGPRREAPLERLR